MIKVINLAGGIKFVEGKTKRAVLARAVKEGMTDFYLYYYHIDKSYAAYPEDPRKGVGVHYVVVCGKAVKVKGIHEKAR